MVEFLAKEQYWGNIEYKCALINMTPVKIKKYATQLKFRIIEGSGIAVYMIGVCDDGKIIGIKNNKITNCNLIMLGMCEEINASIKSKKVIEITPDKCLLVYVLENLFIMGDIPYLVG